MEDELIKILRDFETFKMSDEEKNVYAHTNSYKPFVERIKQVNLTIPGVMLSLPDISKKANSVAEFTTKSKIPTTVRERELGKRAYMNGAIWAQKEINGNKA